MTHILSLLEYAYRQIGRSELDTCYSLRMFVIPFILCYLATLSLTKTWLMQNYDGDEEKGLLPSTT